MNSMFERFSRGYYLGRLYVQPHSETRTGDLPRATRTGQPRTVRDRRRRRADGPSARHETRHPPPRRPGTSPSPRTRSRFHATHSKTPPFATRRRSTRCSWRKPTGPSSCSPVAEGGGGVGRRDGGGYRAPVRPLSDSRRRPTRCEQLLPHGCAFESMLDQLLGRAALKERIEGARRGKAPPRT